MEKKGELLNQLAIISDLLEKVNTELDSRTIILSLPEDEFKKNFEYIQKKQNNIEKLPKDSFTITIGKVDILFNKSNV
jgi:Ribonuclease G/E